MSDTMTILDAPRLESDGSLVFPVVHTMGNHKVEKQIRVPRKDAETITDAATLITWLQEHYPSAPAWTATLVRTSITL